MNAFHWHHQVYNCSMDLPNDVNQKDQNLGTNLFQLNRTRRGEMGKIVSYTGGGTCGGALFLLVMLLFVVLCLDLP